MKKLSVVLFCALVLTAGLSAATKYTVTINISNDQLQFLHSNGFILYGFKGVNSSCPECQPLTWVVTDNYLSRTQITWQDQFSVYDSFVEIRDGAQIAIAYQTMITLGQTGTIQPRTAMITVTSGTKGEITIKDMYEKSPLTTGLSQLVDGQYSQFCACPIMMNEVITLEPGEYVVFFFATRPYSTGTVIMQALSPGIQINVVGSGTTSPSVVYNSNGWRDNKQPWVTQIPIGASLHEYLVNPVQ